ncbi:glycogen/starch synthase [Stigmatella sp. ncwal1]|uniref:starch synthase n=1 Tax=Stigmatella ashevillensis TaxID=2995309 RepID=A0ABT5DLF8_9BACT|nr:glycogen/starch synthase [Stigmatella ashevillena]MDC0713191.1 glycogen/starch synthase [Stigmatella ashevillena]
MHILECYLECGGFDYSFIKGGISVYTWNLASAFRNEGHQVSVLTAAHGRLDYLQKNYPVEELPYRRRYKLPLQLDPRVWRDFEPRQELELETRAYRIRHQGVDLYFLCNDMLDRYSDTFYPPYESKGKDLGFFKPLVFQMDMVLFIREFFADEKLLIHAHEPFYQYLLPLAFRDDASKRMVSTVQSNMPVNKKVYRPELQALLDFLDVRVDLTPFNDAPQTDAFGRCLNGYLPETHLHYPYQDDYIAFYPLLLEYSDAVDFLSEGHLEFYRNFEGTAFKAMFRRLRVAEVTQRNEQKMFVGWCAISDRWHQTDFSQYRREEVLGGLGLRPELPTFFHNARYAVHHKGQNELVRAARKVLEAGAQCNFILRCLSGNGIPDPAYHSLAQDFPAQVRLEWHNRPEEDLIAMAAAADFGLFPSKFEMDTFLIAQGEAMLAGCVPIASRQLGMKHWRHSRAFCANPEQVTGLDVIRSFLANDETLVDSLVHALQEALSLYQDRPRYEQLSQRARARAQEFTWRMSAQAHLKIMERIWKEPRVTSSGSAQPPSAPAAAKTWNAAIHTEGELLGLRRREPTSPGLPTLADTVSAAGQKLQYRLDGARQVESFLEGEGGRFERTLLTRSGDTFEALLPAAAQRRPLFLLVTLADGSQFWDGAVHE